MRKIISTLTVILLYVLSFLISIPLINLFIHDPYQPKHILPYLLLSVFFIVLFGLFRPLLFFYLQKAKTYKLSKKLYVIVVLVLLQIIIASSFYLVYKSNPMVYVVDDEIEKRSKELLIHKSKSELEEIRALEEKYLKELKKWKSHYETSVGFEVNSDGSLLRNDSIIVFRQQLMSFLESETTWGYYFFDNKSLEPKKNIILDSPDLLTGLQNKISSTEKVLIEIDSDLKIKHNESQDKRWDYLNFLSYYFGERLQPMTVGPIIGQWVRRFLWLIIGVLFTLIIPSKWFMKND